MDLLNLEQNAVSSDLREYVIGLYSGSGNGKTTLAADFPSPVFMATDIGYKTLPVFAQPIFSWTDVLLFKGQLSKPEVKEKFKTVVIDTMDMLMFYLQEAICQRHGVKSLNEVPFGKAYDDVKKELRKLFSDIQSMGYGIVIVAHDKIKSDFSDGENGAVDGVGAKTLALSDSLFNIVWGTADIFAYIDVSADGTQRKLCFRKTEQFNAKSRFADIVPSCELSYSALQKAVNDAIIKEAERREGMVVTSERQNYHAQEEMHDDTFDALKTATLALAAEKLAIRPADTQEIIQLHYSKGRLSDITIEDGNVLQLIHNDLEKL